MGALRLATRAPVRQAGGRDVRVRWLVLPAVGCALVALVAAMRRRREPAMEPLSHRWLREHQYTSGQQAESR